MNLNNNPLTVETKTDNSVQNRFLWKLHNPVFDLWKWRWSWKFSCNVTLKCALRIRVFLKEHQSAAKTIITLIKKLGCNLFISVAFRSWSKIFNPVTLEYALTRMQPHGDCLHVKIYFPIQKQLSNSILARQKTRFRAPLLSSNRRKNRALDSKHLRFESLSPRGPKPRENLGDFTFFCISVILSHTSSAAWTCL